MVLWTFGLMIVLIKGQSCDIVVIVVVVMYRMALKYYEDNAVADDDVFLLSVPSCAISAHLNKYEPH